MAGGEGIGIPWCRHSGGTGPGLAGTLGRWDAGKLESCLGSPGVRYSYLLGRIPPKPVYELVDETCITTPRQIANCGYIQTSRNPKDG
jgi:hypothetical protein